jgi:hypothetical protein
MDVFPPKLPPQAVPEQDAPEQPLVAGNLRLLQFVAMVLGIGFALLVSSVGGPAVLWGKTTGVFSPQRNAHTSGLLDSDLDREKPQRQAEILLERAVSRTDETPNQNNEDRTATEIESQIKARIEGWRGQLKWDSQLGDLTTVALNSSDQSVRESAIEVQLAAYGLPKSDSSVDALVRQADSRDHTKKIWALWALGLLGNRGVKTDRVVRVLASHLKDFGKNSDKEKNEDARRWAVEGLALVGTTSTIVPLLDAMHNDPSAIVRKHAACSLAESGMLSHEQRLTAVPKLINDSDDLALDAQTHAWAFQALAEITKQHLPNDSAAWRNWYQRSVASGQ